MVICRRAFAGASSCTGFNLTCLCYALVRSLFMYYIYIHSTCSSIPLKSDNQRDAGDAYSQSFQESKLDSSFPHESDASISMVSRGSILQTPRKNNVAIALQQSGAASAAGSW